MFDSSYKPITNSSTTQTRMQVVNPTPAAVYTGVSNALSTISRVEGMRTLWKGVSSVIVGAGQF